MTNVPRPAQELALLDQELARLDARRGQLLTRRSYLLSLRAVPVPGPPPSAPAFAPPAARPAETSPPGAQNVLLALGGVLLTIAAVAFTLVSWGDLGITGRSAVLAAVTGLALGVPAVLLRRGLRETAEAVAALALVLTVLDAYGLYRVALSDTDGLGFTAVATAGLAALWTAYGLALGRLRIPLHAAVAVAQLPLPLGASAAGAAGLTTAWALLLTAALDTAVALWARPRSVRIVAAVAAGVTGCGALLTGGVLSLVAATPAGAAGPALLLLTAAALALFVGHRRAAGAAGGAVVCAVVAGLASVAAVGGVVRPALPEGWAVPGYLLCGAVVGAVATLVPAVGVRLPRPALRGLALAAAIVGAAAVLWALPSVALVPLGGVRRLMDIWAGPPADARAALGSGTPWLYRSAAPLVLLMAAGAAAVAHRRLPVAADAGKPGRAAALAGALTLTWAALVPVPATLDLGFPAAVAVPVALTAATLALTVTTRGPLALTALCCAPAGAVVASLLSLATRSWTVGVLAMLTALFAGAAVAAELLRTRDRQDAEPAAPAPRLIGAVLGCVAVVYATGLTIAACRAAGLSVEFTGVTLLAVPAVVALPATVPRLRPVALPLEVAGACAALLAVVLATGRAPVLALVLALCGVLAAGTAVRPERRRVAGRTAAVLFVLASWVRLGASGVGVPEAYTLPASVPALAMGLLRRRRDPEASSWTAYGPGLAATLLPSLLAAWGDPEWTRPLLLGVAALAVTLIGARQRLQAPLVLGGAVLALVALHELAPYVVQVVDALPRWLVPALAGVLLLAVGATYEKRLRDARRLRTALGRMH